MTHKENVKAHCMDYLQQLDLSQYFNISEFERFYKTSNGIKSNAYSLGLLTADFFINNSKPFNYESGNAS